MNSNVSQTEAMRELARRELASRFLGRFIHYFFEGYQENWHHRLIIEKLEAVERGEVKKLMIFVPPQNGKSEIASVNFPAWYLGRNSSKAIIAASYNADLAVGFGRKARNIVNTREYRNVFHGIALSEDSTAAGRWITGQGGEYVAVGIGGGTTGRRADVVIIDDPIKDRQEAESAVIQERNIDWYRAVIRTRLSPSGAIVLIQTRWHDKDLAGQILATEHGWETIELPAIAEVDEKYRKAGEPLWPTRYPLAWLEEQKASLGSELWSSLYQQKPISEGFQVFRSSMFKSRDERDLEKLDKRCFVTIDPAPAKTESSDYIGVCINWVDSENFWNLKAYRVRFDPTQLINMLFKIYEDTKFERVGIERGTYNDVLRPFLEEEMRRRNVFFNVEELDHGQRSKDLRIRGLLPRYEAGQIFHLIGYCADLESELVRFPVSAHDDVMDAVAYQLQISAPPGPREMRMEALAERRREREASKRDVGL